MADDKYEDDSDLGFGCMPDDPRQTFTSDPTYNATVSKALLLKSDYLDAINYEIANAGLMPDCKTALLLISKGLFDKVAVLAKTVNTNYEYIDAELALQSARLGYTSMDVDNPQLVNIENMILLHYRQFISRSEKGWERGLQNKNESSLHQTMRTESPQPQQKRGFFRR